MQNNYEFGLQSSNNSSVVSSGYGSAFGNYSFHQASQAALQAEKNGDDQQNNYQRSRRSRGQPQAPLPIPNPDPVSLENAQQ